MALAVSPARLEKGRLEALAPWGFEAHLARLDDPDMDLVYPCGAWFQPPTGHYRAWVEGEWEISPYSVVLGYSGRPFRDRGLVAAIPVAEAGRVAPPPGLAVPQGVSLRLLHAGNYLEGEFPRWEVSRRVRSPRLGEGVLMPVGPTIAALWNNESQAYTALSRPFEVKAHQTVAAPLERPQGVAALIVQLQRPRLARTAAEYREELLVKRQGKVIPPDLKISAADRIYAVWYDLAPGPVDLTAESQRSFLDATPLRLHSGKIERFFTQLKPHPNFGLKEGE